MRLSDITPATAVVLLAVQGLAVWFLLWLFSRLRRWNERRIARRMARETLAAWWADADDSRLEEIDGSDGNDEGIVRAAR